jgi:hypothetical protein
MSNLGVEFCRRRNYFDRELVGVEVGAQKSVYFARSWSDNRLDPRKRDPRTDTSAGFGVKQEPPRVCFVESEALRLLLPSHPRLGRELALVWSACAADAVRNSLRCQGVPPRLLFDCGSGVALENISVAALGRSGLEHHSYGHESHNSSQRRAWNPIQSFIGHL